MAPIIKFDQSGKPAGVGGQARSDLDLGLPVTLTLQGGPYLSQLWTILDKPVDFAAPAQSSAGVVSPTAAITTIQPIDVAGTYFLQVAVDSGLGLGATVDDVARLPFYAGPALSAVWNARPRRRPAFLERDEFNEPDAIFPSGKRRGWAQELDRWFGLIEAASSIAAFARVQLSGGGATILSGFNVATATRTGTGVVDLAFSSSLGSSDYIVLPTARGPTGGSCAADLESPTGFTLSRADPGGSLADADFNVLVLLP
jgi:hypothetical protein